MNSLDLADPWQALFLTFVLLSPRINSVHPLRDLVKCRRRHAYLRCRSEILWTSIYIPDYSVTYQNAFF